LRRTRAGHRIALEKEGKRMSEDKGTGQSCPLDKRHCVPCEGGVGALSEAEIAPLHEELAGGWVVVDGHHLEKTFKFEDWASALAFTNRVGELADAEGHHPSIGLSWGRVGVTLWTHKVDGLTESDFVLAARIEALPR
jgi:4a-hydroxytetrahydrobiopterin dehydratase